MINGVSYERVPGRLVAAESEYLEKMVDLYSNHYGVWSPKGVRPGEKIKLSSEKMKKWLENENVTVYYAELEDETIIGYAIALSKDEKKYGHITWVTQLVVHKNHRKKGIAERLLFSIWGFSDHYAWGIVSANPYAIRALEKATRRRAKTIRIKKNSRKLMNVGRQNVPFIHDDTELKVNSLQSVINTQFYVDHSETLKMLDDVISDDLPWELGYIEEGWEWFAFTFKDQPQIKLSKEEIMLMIETADEVVKKAYERMAIGGKTTAQKWANNTTAEIDYLSQKIGFENITRVYDLGCGSGRHSIELAKRGMNVTGIDYIPVNVEKAKKAISSIRTTGKYDLNNIEIEVKDCRSYTNSQKANLVICLYDVVGSFASDEDNIKIIKTAYDLLSPNGFAVFSVMNYVTTVNSAKHKFVFDEDPNILLDLLPSSIMETSGNIYNPDYYCVDTKTHLVYRKERFVGGNDLPVELIVRDRRFTKEEITGLCKKIGFSIVEAKYTNASGWEYEYDADCKRAKEILIICKKP